ncbi:MAG: hypothetical protein O2905_00435 [Proteobacteria bacterium]|nr:hypothetical protein [Pseudomonadota bacterium]
MAVTAPARAPGLVLAVLVAWVFRAGVFVVAAVRPIANERGDPVSPLLPQSYLDFEFYAESLRLYAGSWADILGDFIRFYRDPATFDGGPIISGPVFPALIGLFGYGPGSYLPLELFFLAVSCGMVAFWLWWLAGQGLGRGWLLAFALIPNPVWFTLVASPDLLFAAIFAGFFYFYFVATQGRWQTATWIALLVLLPLTRPNGYSSLVFVSLHVLWTAFQHRRIEVGRAALAAFLLIVFALFLYPYFLSEMRKAGSILSYFGHTPADYVAGIYPLLPRWLDLPMSWGSLVVAKLMYFTGLRPSYGVTAPAMVLARAAAGLVLLPGLVFLLVRAPLRDKALIVLFALPILIGPSQERYYLPIYPILFLYGAWFYRAAWTRLRTITAAPA